jgi:hypothetical protein|tara:strand:- start:82 stop:1002 length:921 start_codon:yes stop_codon:yes gene_type:complete
MANVTVSVTGVKAIVNQTTWGANQWGTGSWNQGGFINANNIAFNSEGWGRAQWGNEAWGENGLPVQVSVTGQQSTISIGSVNISADINVGWGRKTWGNLVWGGAFTTAVTGQQITSSIGSVVASADVVVKPTTQTITAGVGTVDIEADATFVHVHAPQINSAVGSPVVTNFESFSVSGVSATSQVGTAAVVGSRVIELTGQQINSGFGSTFKAFTDITIRPTGFQISSGIGNVRVISSFKVTGQVITSSLGTVTTKQTAVVKPTGLQVDSGVGFPFVTAWAPLDTGSSVTYSDLNTGSNVTWTRAA